MALYCNNQQTLQARLATHHLKVEQVYIMKMPWVREKNLSFVTVLSSKPAAFQVFRDKSLKQILDQRFGGKQDPEFYSMDQKKKVYVVYRTGETELDFVGLLEN